MDGILRTTMHNGRAGKNGVYSAKHNSRTFDLKTADNIYADRVCKNRYLLVSPAGEISCVKRADFDRHEHDFYTIMFGDALEAQNNRYRKKRNYDRVKTIDDYRTSTQTCPEETIFQIGTRTDDVSSVALSRAVSDWMVTMQKKYGSNIHIMDVALHMDEQTPHIHCRYVWSHETADGRAVSQTKALAALGIERPDKDKAKSKYNNAKMTFTAEARDLWIAAVRAQGIDVETTPAEPGKRTIALEDYVYQQTHAEVQKLSDERLKLRQETERLAAERARLQSEVQLLREEKSRLQRIVERLASSLMRLLDKLSRLLCMDGRYAIEHVRDDVQAVIDSHDELHQDDAIL